MWFEKCPLFYDLIDIFCFRNPKKWLLKLLATPRQLLLHLPRHKTARSVLQLQKKAANERKYKVIQTLIKWWVKHCRFCSHRLVHRTTHSSHMRWTWPMSSGSMTLRHLHTSKEPLQTFCLKRIWEGCHHTLLRHMAVTYTHSKGTCHPLGPLALMITGLKHPLGPQVLHCLTQFYSTHHTL